MITKNDIDLIDKYLLNQLSNTEVDEFRIREKDTEFANELELMKKINSAIINSNRLQLKKQLDKIHNLNSNIFYRILDTTRGKIILSVIALAILSGLSIYLFNSPTSSQSTSITPTEKINGSLLTIDSAKITILSVTPDSFPNVSVLFKAERMDGEPVWNLTSDKMIALENQLNCKVLSIEQVSKNKPIDIGIVIDHSGSMIQDASQLFNKDGFPLFYYDANSNIILPKNYRAPIDNAKGAVKKFISSFNSKKDFISVIGFSNIVDRKLSLTQNISSLNSIVDSMQADFSTALYDAMITGIDEIKNADGVKVLVMLTDGNDNSSKSKWNDVILKAKQEEIPIYIIGLGDVNKDTLNIIANATGGEFYFTQTSNSFDTIYSKISRRVQAFYSLVYRSTNISSIDTTRSIEVSFNTDSLYLITNPFLKKFNPEVLEFVAQKEKQKEYFIYGGIAVAITLTAGALLFYFKRKGN